MPWAVAAAAVGAGGAIYGANKAANTQGAAAANANQLQAQQYGDTVSRNQPFVQGGTSAYNALLGRLGLSGSSDTTAGYGTLGKVPTAADVMATPGYQFGLDQGQQSLDRRITASGMNGSGAALKAAARYGTDYATTKYDDAFNNNLQAQNATYNQLIGASQLGQASANNTASAGSQYATNAGNNLMGAANASGAATLAGVNAAQGALNQGVSSYNNSNGNVGSYNQYNSLTGYSTNPNPGSSDFEGINTGGGSPTRGGMADGGPVRSEPKIGTYSPVPGGGGGGMSRDAILAQLMARQQQPQPPQRSGMGTLPANPLMSPRGVLAGQEQQAGTYAWGGQVSGPGTQKSDSIPAYLSNGEHVMDAASVTAMGNGNNERGQQKLNMLRARLKMKD